MKTIELKCAYCEAVVVKELREYKRQIKNGNNRFFCNNSCSAKKINSEVKRIGNPEFLVAGNRRDEFTPFRWFILRAQYRDRKKKYGCDLNVEYLKHLWEIQNGLCPFTGWSLILPQDTNGWKLDHSANASIDRLDNSKGYMRDNVRFISVIANYARNRFTDEQLKHFCQAVTNND